MKFKKFLFLSILFAGFLIMILFSQSVLSGVRHPCFFPDSVCCTEVGCRNELLNCLSGCIRTEQCTPRRQRACAERALFGNRGCFFGKDCFSPSFTCGSDDMCDYSSGCGYNCRGSIDQIRVSAKCQPSSWDDWYGCYLDPCDDGAGGLRGSLMPICDDPPPDYVGLGHDSQTTPPNVNIGATTTFNISLTGLAETPSGAVPADIMFVIDGSGSMTMLTDPLDPRCDIDGPAYDPMNCDRKVETAKKALELIYSYFKSYNNSKNRYYYRTGLGAFNHEVQISRVLHVPGESCLDRSYPTLVGYEHLIGTGPCVPSGSCGCTGIEAGLINAVAKTFYNAEYYDLVPADPAPPSQSPQSCDSVKKVVILASDGVQNRDILNEAHYPDFDPERVFPATYGYAGAYSEENMWQIFRDNYYDKIKNPGGADQQITFYTIGVGSPESSWRWFLEKISREWGTGKGETYWADNITGLYELYENVAEIYREGTEPANKISVRIKLTEYFEFVSSQLGGVDFLPVRVDDVLIGKACSDDESLCETDADCTAPAACEDNIPEHGREIEWEFPDGISKDEIISIDVTVRAVKGYGVQDVIDTAESSVRIHNKCEPEPLSFGNIQADIQQSFCQPGNHNVRGWGWSENVGWISFSCQNCDSDGDGITDAQCPPAGEFIIDYGVNIDDATGVFSGYAWSENIGWIDFNPDSPYPESPTYSVCLDLPEAGQACDGVGDWTVSGWARALAPIGESIEKTGGWDGWIKLRGTVPGVGTYGVSLDTSDWPLSQFTGWAWGGDDDADKEEAVIGLISFNHLNCDPDGNGQSDGLGNCPAAGTPISDYKVGTTVGPPNAPPEIVAGSQIITSHYYCGAGQGKGSIHFQWTYYDPNDDPETRFEFAIDTDTVFDESSVFYYSLDNPEGPTNNKVVFIGDDIDFNTSYYWGVRVWDDKGNNSGWVYLGASADDHFPVPPGSPVNPGSSDDGNPDTFTTASHAWPRPAFTWSPESPVVALPISFTDETTFYNTGTSWTWDFGDVGSSSSAEQNPTYDYSKDDVYTVTLTAEDSAGYACSTTNDIRVGMPLGLPEWKEVPPF